MLVLSRQEDERIIIEVFNVVIAVQVVDIRGDKVRLGFQAPAIVEIDREEVRRRKQQVTGALEDYPPASDERDALANDPLAMALNPAIRRDGA